MKDGGLCAGASLSLSLSLCLGLLCPVHCEPPYDEMFCPSPPLPYPTERTFILTCGNSAHGAAYRKRMDIKLLRKTGPAVIYNTFYYYNSSSLVSRSLNVSGDSVHMLNHSLVVLCSKSVMSESCSVLKLMRITE